MEYPDGFATLRPCQVQIVQIDIGNAINRTDLLNWYF